MEAEQEKKRAQDQANFLKTIKLKIVQGSSSVLVGGGGSGSSQPRATASSKPAAPAAAKPMAPSSMFLSATKSPGEGKGESGLGAVVGGFCGLAGLAAQARHLLMGGVGHTSGCERAGDIGWLVDQMVNCWDIAGCQHGQFAA